MKIQNTSNISYRSYDATGMPVPAILLQGKFLQSYGFFRGETVAVEYRRGRIIISLIINGQGGGDEYGLQTEFSFVPN